jgi:hypothetical protein
MGISWEGGSVQWRVPLSTGHTANFQAKSPGASFRNTRKKATPGAIFNIFIFSDGSIRGNTALKMENMEFP